MKNNNIKEELEKLNNKEIYEQTFLSWAQVSLALISVGIGVGSVIAFMESHHYEKIMIKIIRIIGEFLIFIGLVSMIVNLMKHKTKLKSLENKYQYKYLLNLPLLIGAIITLLGLFSFTIILIHMFL